MLKTLLKIQFASFKASLMRNRRRQAKGGAGRTIGMALPSFFSIEPSTAPKRLLSSSFSGS